MHRGHRNVFANTLELLLRAGGVTRHSENFGKQAASGPVVRADVERVPQLRKCLLEVAGKDEEVADVPLQAEIERAHANRGVDLAQCRVEVVPEQQTVAETRVARCRSSGLAATARR